MPPPRQGDQGAGLAALVVGVVLAPAAVAAVAAFAPSGAGDGASSGSTRSTRGDDGCVRIESSSEAKTLRRTSESEPVLMWRSSCRSSCCSFGAFVRLPLWPSVMPYGEFT